tara:strand:+ start:327 stop:521 length:195 start_codon:yes stop_codon:yes gene_type:complete
LDAVCGSAKLNMIICVCKNISESKLKEIIAEEDITNINQLQKQDDIGSCCRICIKTIKDLLKGL